LHVFSIWAKLSHSDIVDGFGHAEVGSIVDLDSSDQIVTIDALFWSSASNFNINCWWSCSVGDVVVVAEVTGVSITNPAFSIDLSSDTIIVDVGTCSCALLCVSAADWHDVHLEWFILKRVSGDVLFNVVVQRGNLCGVLHWNNVSSSQVKVEHVSI